MTKIELTFEAERDLIDIYLYGIEHFGHRGRRLWREKPIPSGAVEWLPEPGMGDTGWDGWAAHPKATDGVVFVQRCLNPPPKTIVHKADAISVFAKSSPTKSNRAPLVFAAT